MNKTIVFDMDGTIADLYGVENWLEMLRKEDVTPYAKCKPMVDMLLIDVVLNELKKCGYKIVVVTWTAKNGSVVYNENTARVKKAWLDKYNFPYDEFFAVEYGTDKMKSTIKYGGFQIIIDDDPKVRENWYGGATVDPTQTDIIDYLFELLI